LQDGVQVITRTVKKIMEKVGEGKRRFRERSRSVG
jgi:hypothetical protein